MQVIISLTFALLKLYYSSADKDSKKPSIQTNILICADSIIMENIKEYQHYLEALDEEKSAMERRNAIKRLYECKTDECVYYLNEIMADRDNLLPDWLKNIAREYYVELCLEFL